ncbi:MAG: hypothetical protein JW944_12805 [Deltaproteobacteria bacterium]|nr:hypothetical protein [Deltaproteobacteria bacterium]
MSTSVSFFLPEKGTREYFIIAVPDNDLSFPDQFLAVSVEYRDSLDALKLDINSCVYMNIYLSDAAGQEDAVLNSSFYRELHESRAGVLILQIPPMSSKVAILAYHVVPEVSLEKELISVADGPGAATSISTNSYEHHYLKGLTSGGPLSAQDQIRNLLNTVSLFCKSRNIPHKNIIRTWIYIRDINKYYNDMAETRREVFVGWGLSEKDRFPASTGIGGRNKYPDDLLLMDAIIIGGMEDGQVQRMEAALHMPHAMNYGVTFERGIRVRYGDREHLYISGTASIGANGDVMHKDDILRQTERTLENIRALLEGASRSIDELKYLIVYIKNSDDGDLVNSYLKANLADHIPFVLLQADICRQGWLIEIEGMAVSKAYNPQYKDY